jgi:hypothetical protein
MPDGTPDADHSRSTRTGRWAVGFRKSSAVLWLGSALLFSGTVHAQPPQGPLPAPWESADIGDVGVPGSAFQGPDGDLFVAGAGSDIWGTADSFRYVYQPMRDGFVTARVGSETNTHRFAKIGVMIRQSLDPGSPTIVVDVKPDGGVEVLMRATPGGEMTFVGGGSVPATDSGDGQVALAASVNLSRRGNTVVAGYCVDRSDGGLSCGGVGPVMTFPSGPIFAGVAVTSHDPSQLNHGHFRAPLPIVRAVPDPWVSTDVGGVGTTGFATHEDAADTFFVTGAGADIWGSADSFHAVTQWLNADVTVTARLVGEQHTHVFAKAGIEIGDPWPDAPRVLLDVKPDGGVEFMARMAAGASMSFLSGAGASFPVWLRITRSGDRFDGLISSDGQTWTTVGSVTMNLPAVIRAGLAVTSHEPSVLNTAQFDHVSVTSSAVSTGNLLRNPGFEESNVPDLGPGWVSDRFRQAPAHSASAAPHSGSKYGGCETTTALDCGIYQELVVAQTDNYMFSAFVAADKPGALVGVDVNGVGTGRQVLTGGYEQYRIGLFLRAGDTIRVWVYSPASSGRVFVDDASFAIDTGPR